MKPGALLARSGALLTGLGALLAAAAGPTLSAHVPVSSTITTTTDAPVSVVSHDTTSPSPTSPLPTTPRRGGAVTWGADTLSIAGRPFNLWSAEFHQFRLAGGHGLWRDALQKLKSGGFNAISIYTHWALTMPQNDAASVDLSGINDVGALLDIARDEGLFVIVRPGPYINAETYNGGMPGWVTELDAQLRTNQTAYYDAWVPYMDAILNATLPRQAKLGSNGDLDVSGGSVIGLQIENEFPYSTVYNQHFEELIRFVKQRGLQVPTTFNEAGGIGQYANSTDLDLWGWDNYPLGFDCSNPSQWQPVPDYNSSLIQFVNSTTRRNPGFIPEFQAGSFDPYGGPGYEKCYELVNANFARVFDKNVLSQGLRMLSHYMGYGGTNWGWIAYGSVVYTSYDYGAGLSEERLKRDKLREYRLMAGFLSGFPEFATAKRNSTVERDGALVTRHVSSSSAAAPAPGTSWYFVRNNDSTSTETISLKLPIATSQGDITVPRNGALTLSGRDYVIVPVDKPLPASNTRLLYSTADVSDVLQIDGRDVLLFSGATNVEYELALAPSDQAGNLSGQPPSAEAAAVASVNVSTSAAAGGPGPQNVVINWKITKSGGVAFYEVAGAGARRILCVFADHVGAYTTQSLSTAPRNSLDFFLNQGQARVLVAGAYHVASAEIQGDGGRVALRGQSNATAPLEVVAPAKVGAISFNGQELQVSRSPYGTLKATLPGPSQAALDWKPPALEGWRYADSLPEISKGYELPPGLWLEANKTSTYNPFFAYNSSTGGTVLYQHAYGFDAGHVLWRGTFDVAADDAKPTSLTLRVDGGKYFGASVWLNGRHLGSLWGNSTSAFAQTTFTLKGNDTDVGENVLLVLHDNTGNNQADYLLAVNDNEGGASSDGGSGATNPAFEESSSSVESSIARSPPPRLRFQKRDVWPSPPSSPSLPLEAPKAPRGITVFRLEGPGGAANTTVTWRVAGQYRGRANPDKVRKAYNEGGLLAERLGWHLPGFDDSQWPRRNLEEGLPDGQTAGVGFWRTTVRLDVPEGHDVPLGFEFDGGAASSNGTANDYRALLFVNGWQFGVRLARFGPQTTFVVPAGVLDPRGENTVAVSVWSLGASGHATATATATAKPSSAAVKSLRLVVLGRALGDVEYTLDNPGYAELRAA